MSNHSRTAKRLLKSDFLKLYIQNQERRERYKHKNTNFYFDSLKSELHPICKGNST